MKLTSMKMSRGKAVAVAAALLASAAAPALVAAPAGAVVALVPTCGTLIKGDPSATYDLVPDGAIPTATPGVAYSTTGNVTKGQDKLIYDVTSASPSGKRLSMALTIDDSTPAYNSIANGNPAIQVGGVSGTPASPKTAYLSLTQKWSNDKSGRTMLPTTTFNEAWASATSFGLPTKIGTTLSPTNPIRIATGSGSWGGTVNYALAPAAFVGAYDAIARLNNQAPGATVFRPYSPAAVSALTGGLITGSTGLLLTSWAYAKAGTVPTSQVMSLVWPKGLTPFKGTAPTYLPGWGTGFIGTVYFGLVLPGNPGAPLPSEIGGVEPPIDNCSSYGLLALICSGPLAAALPASLAPICAAYGT